jgi:hypothetical protein
MSFSDKRKKAFSCDFYGVDKSAYSKTEKGMRAVTVSIK